jgi:type I restriction enzyme M protein
VRLFLSALIGMGLIVPFGHAKCPSHFSNAACARSLSHACPLQETNNHMTSSQQRAELQRRIWAIANEVRGAVDGWDFKQYVLGTLFYRFISENFASYLEGGDDSVDYAALSDAVITPDTRDDAIKAKGYFIYPSQLFVNVAKNAHNNDSLNTDLAAIFAAIESSANGYPSEHDIKGLFADFDTTSRRLGNTVADKNKRLAAVLKGVSELNFGEFGDNQIDLFGDAYEFLISNYAANAGKSGGEFFTPQHVSKLIAQLAMHRQTSVNKIYDPACGSGSLLLQAKKHFDAHLIEEGFFGQELNHTTYNLARMNMFLHDVNYDKFNIALGDTLEDPQFAYDEPFCPCRGAGPQIQGRYGLCDACTELSVQQGACRHRVLSRHLLPGRGGAKNPQIPGR